jgi:hypothetical protein
LFRALTPPKRRERFEMPSSAVAFSGFRKLKMPGWLRCDFMNFL